MTTKSALVLVAALGCGGSGYFEPWVEPAAGPRVAVVARKLDLRAEDWKRTGWVRISDELFATPVHVFVTADRRACVVDGRMIVEVQVRKRYRCEDGWRSWRGR